MVAVNESCRAENTCFIYAVTMSVFAQVFCDLGEYAFVVTDAEGAPAVTPSYPWAIVTREIEQVLYENPAVIKVGYHHGLDTGEKVTFSHLRGISGIEIGREYVVKVIDQETFALPDVDLSQFKSAIAVQQGYFTKVKNPGVLMFDSYKDTLENPGNFMRSDGAKVDRPDVLHLGFRAVSQYMAATGELPAPGDTVACAKVYEMAKMLDTNGVLSNNETNNKRIVAHWRVDPDHC